MPEAEINKIQLTEEERTAIVTQLKQTILSDGVSLNLTESDKQDIAGQISDNISSGTLSVKLSDADKADIIKEVLAELYAKSQDVNTLEEVTSLNGINSIPAVRTTDNAIVSVPLGLVTTNQPIEVSGQEAIDILVAQGKIVPTQLYFTPVDDE